jgi:hypothetical protein
MRINKQLQFAFAYIFNQSRCVGKITGSQARGKQQWPYYNLSVVIIVLFALYAIKVEIVLK